MLSVVGLLRERRGKQNRLLVLQEDQNDPTGGTSVKSAYSERSEWKLCVVFLLTRKLPNGGGRVLVAVSGRHGAGKTTLAKAIASHFNLTYVSAGEIFREMAQNHEMDLIEFTRYAEDHPEIDRQIDQKMQAEAKKGNRVLDSQLAYYFSKDLNPINILVFAKEEDVIRRVSEREGISLEKAREEVKTREKNERQRFMDLYGVDLWDPKDFDLMINTSRISKHKAKKIALESVAILGE